MLFSSDKAQFAAFAGNSCNDRNRRAALRLEKIIYLSPLGETKVLFLLAAVSYSVNLTPFYSTSRSNS